MVGCEIGGSVKNVIALAAGMAVGLGYSDNTMAAVVTRGLAELTRFGVALGGQPLTFLGLAGMGDLVVTCHSSASRNHRVGVELGRGRPPRGPGGSGGAGGSHGGGGGGRRPRHLH